MDQTSPRRGWMLIALTLSGLCTTQGFIPTLAGMFFFWEVARQQVARLCLSLYSWRAVTFQPDCDFHQKSFWGCCWLKIAFNSRPHAKKSFCVLMLFKTTLFLGFGVSRKRLLFVGHLEGVAWAGQEERMASWEGKPLNLLSLHLTSQIQHWPSVWVFLVPVHFWLFMFEENTKLRQNQRNKQGFSMEKTTLQIVVRVV